MNAGGGLASCIYLKPAQKAGWVVGVQTTLLCSGDVLGERKRRTHVFLYFE